MARPHALPVGYPYVPSASDAERGGLEGPEPTRTYFLRRRLLLGLYYSRLRFGARIVDPLLRVAANHVLCQPVDL